MKVRHTLICFFFLSLQDGNTGLTNAQIPSVHTGTEGGDIRVRCSFSSPGVRKFFCKRECKPEDILTETTGVRNQSGRYRISNERRRFFFVRITQLIKSDSGRYRCGLGRPSSPDSYLEFKIIVTDAHVVPTSKPKLTLPVFSTSDPSASTPTQISQTDQQQTGTASPRGTSTLFDR
ncbi:high affinity immunoglobulin alpha and immunoglobulin mu Fc receptor-like [Micropterus dolomieu]|uniref:high affinity immunoglobulin alpha and immunoglobulin mu Fc receptor-like n=1 Tax=Micropterus dolomieu TaxID=147949 RepID=UPI001E8D5BA4|nr:high affinity immunoglobulin alpha and immunoglobulin mu Fc receptor-like [Micropterus dolomieu]